jgi:hypothetical protein
MARREPNIRKLAQRQRWLIWLVLVSIISQFFPLTPLGSYGMFVAIAFSIVAILVYVFMIVGVVLLLSAHGTHIVLIILCGILMMAPCGNLLLLLLVNQVVTRTLKRAGLHVGLLGVRPEEV